MSQLSTYIQSFSASKSSRCMLDYTSYILSRSADLTVDASDLRTPTYSYVERPVLQSALQNGKAHTIHYSSQRLQCLGVPEKTLGVLGQ